MTNSYAWLPSLLLCGFTSLVSTPAIAQITPDNTLGAARSRLTPNVTLGGENGDRIDGGATRGSNLFHSFSQFNIDDGQRVYFGNPSGIQNILTRVTGGNTSSILGTLGVDGGANLFLLNPNGIIFGQNASLDVRGSFVGTTANAIGFGDLGFFNATDPSVPPLLTVNPSALLYTQINRGAIANQGLLTAQTGQSLVLAGGDIDFNQGSMAVQGGRIELAAIAGTGTVGLNADNSLSIPTDLSRADVALFSSEIGVTTGNNSGVAIHARNLDISANSQVYSRIGSDVEAVDPTAGDITLNATDTMQIREGSLIANGVFEGESGKGGNINVTIGSLSLSDGAQIYTTTLGSGDAGSVLVQAKDSVSASNSAIFSIVGGGAVGNGGNINITAPTLSLTDSQLGTTVRGASNNLPAGEGIAGNVNVNVSGDVTISGGKNGFSSGILSSLGRGAKGKGGNINITAGSLSLSDGALLEASTGGLGDAGSVFVQAKDYVSAGNSDIKSSVESGAKGNGGNINITAPTLSLTDGTQLLTLVREASNNLPAGEGIAGNVNVNVSGDVTISGVKDGAQSGIFSSLETGAKGKGGNINITASSLSLSDGALLDASTFGTGDAGSVIIDARRVFLDGNNTSIYSFVETTGRGKGGDIRITTDSLSLTNGAGMTASTYGFGDAGNVLVQAKDSVSAAGNSLIANSVEGEAVGNGGNINITASTLSLTDGTQLLTLVREASNNLPAGEGIAGNVFVNVSGDVTISGGKNGASGINSYLGTGAKGKGGNINVKTGSLSLSDSAFLISSTGGFGDAGSVLVQAKDSVSASDSAIFSNVENGAVGNGGNIFITASTLSLTDASQLATAVREASNNLPAGEGIAGNVFVEVSGDVTMSGVKDGFNSGIFSFLGTGAKGKGGNINVKTGSLSLSDGSQIAANTSGKGDAGNVEINTTGEITFNNGSNVTAATYGDGNAGNVTVTAGGTASFDGVANNGNRSGIFTTVGTEAGFVGRGDGGNINLTSPTLSITNDAAISSSSFGEGFAGDININSDSVRLDNQGKIFASTNSGNGGNINLTAANFLLLRRSSGISTTAGLTQLGGDGGNITINSPFIIALPNENSDISANAYSGRGGNISIDAQSIFGIQARSLPTPFSDITASSQLGVQGQISITEPNVQPEQGLVELPASVLDASDQIAQVCPNGATAARPLGEFVVTGRGSLPPNPLELLAGTTSLSPLASIDGAQANISQHTSSPPATTTTPNTIVEAQGWVKTEDGKIALVANAPQATPLATTTQATCPVSK